MFGRRFFEEGHARMFEKGHLKFVILDVLQDKPSHGYEIIKKLEEKFHGFYTPSAGSVYPTLQMLEDMGYVSSAVEDGKKVYTITDEGKKFLSDRKETTAKIKARMKEHWERGERDEMRKTVLELRDTVMSLRGRFFDLDDEKIAKIRQIIIKTRAEIEEVLKE
jgi:DNA-binding PadR family transcriptional regulator